jgi:hypothetical protein
MRRKGAIIIVVITDPIFSRVGLYGLLGSLSYKTHTRIKRRGTKMNINILSSIVTLYKYHSISSQKVKV